MANAGVIPTYSYRPADGGVNPRLRTHSGRRGRLVNDTYFRSKDVGQKMNNISVACVKTGATTGRLYVTNHNTLLSESVVASPGVVLEFVDTSGLDWQTSYTFTVMGPELLAVDRTIGANTSRITQIDPRQLFVSPEGVSLKIDLNRSTLAVGATVRLVPRVQSYNLTWITVTDQTTGVSVSGFDIAALRALVKANANSWIQMPERAIKDGAPVIPPPDAQDDGEDEKVLLAFPDTVLSGGDGLPDNPDGQKTGPSRSLIHLNYSETEDGSMGVVNVVYEWSGETHVIGEWLPLF